MTLLFRATLLLVVCLFSLTAQTSTNPLYWSRYLPGGGADKAVAVVVDRGGDVWVAGTSNGSYEAYGPNEPFQLTRAGKSDAYIAKFRPFPDGSAQVLFFTWIGGADNDEAVDMKLDSQGRVVLIGQTFSNNFPLAGNALQTTPKGDSDIFIAVFNPDAGGASSLVYSTYFGGASRDTARAVAIGPNDSINVLGVTISDNLPSPTTQPNRRGGQDAFVMRTTVNNGGGLEYSTYFGGSNTDDAWGITVDRNNVIWFTGSTGSDDFPLANAFQASSTGFFDAYVVGLDPARSGLDALIYGTLIGGAQLDEGRSIALDAQGNLWVAGITFSPDFPITSGAAQSTHGGLTDAFLVRLNPRIDPSQALLYSTFVGGPGTEIVYGLTAIDQNRASLVGYSMSATGSLPTTANAYQKTAKSGFADGMVAIVDTSKSGTPGIEYLSYFGGSSTDVINAVAIDPTNPKALVFCGYTISADLPVTDKSGRSNEPPAPNAFLTILQR